MIHVDGKPLPLDAAAVLVWRRAGGAARIVREGEGTETLMAQLHEAPAAAGGALISIWRGADGAVHLYQEGEEGERLALALELATALGLEVPGAQAVAQA